MRISVMSWEQSCILTQFFKVKIRFYKLFFRNQANFTIFRVYQLINMKTSIMSWENITYLHAIFQTLIFTFTNHFLRICNFFNFLCVSSALAYEYDTQEHPKKIFKKLYKDLFNESGNRHICRNQANFSIFRVYQLIDLAPQSTRKKFSIFFMRTSIMNWETITYSHTIF